MRKIFIIALVAITFASCKDEKKEDGNNQPAVEAPAPKNDFFQVTIDLIAKKDDSFHVFFNEDGGSNFTEENSVWVEFKGSESPQKLTFNLPKDVVPAQLRVDFGVNKEQEDVKINNMEISYLGNTTTISAAQFFTLFRPNEQSTAFDVPNQLIKRLKGGKDGSNASAYPLEGLTQELRKLAQ